jgi:hypothetical protein
MLILRALCRWFPGLRFLFVGIGYIMLVIGGVVWFICFPLTVYTLYVSGQFPLDYFGISVYLGFPLDFFLPRDMWRAVGGICAAFTLYGLFVIYFNVRNLRRLRLGETGG